LRLDSQSTLRELAFIVGTALDAANISAVLSGGGAASVYAPEANQSHDLDFILSFWSSLGASAKAILDLGFSKKNGSYVHPATSFTLEFPQGPLAIGNQLITQWSTLREDDQVLNILNPTDCVRDRLCWFLMYANADYSALEQALAVAVRQEIDLDLIKNWCAEEGVLPRFEIFESRYRQMKAL
jgi:hypothetical protein